MTDFILSIDPGLENGISLIGYEPDKAPRLVRAWQFPGGVVGFLKWHKTFVIPPADDFAADEYDYHGYLDISAGPELKRLMWDEITTVAEKFQPISHADYALTTASVEPLRIEGAMIALGMMPDYPDDRWRAPTLQYVAGGNGKAEKKKRLHALLKATGFYVAPKDLGTPDADDVRSSIGHTLAYLARVKKHRPTFDLIANGVK